SLHNRLSAGSPSTCSSIEKAKVAFHRQGEGALGAVAPEEGKCRSGYLANVQGEADQLWKFCTAVCFCESRRSSSRIALMREAEEWPGWRSSVELVG
ncbi:hypothetical protein FD755_012843, partial [Muntiacus reevesi]